MELIIRNMVCDRCKAAVEAILMDHGLLPEHIALGVVELKEAPSAVQFGGIRTALLKSGFELVDDPSQVLVERIKAAVVTFVHHSDPLRTRVKLSDHLQATINTDPGSLSSLFSQMEGVTIERFYLLQRLERVKELIQYGESTLNEIADQTGFSSAAHLSAQFKKFVGITPTAFRSSGLGRRPIDRVS